MTFYQRYILEKLSYDYAIIDTYELSNGNMVFLNDKTLYLSNSQGVKEITQKQFIELLNTIYKAKHYFITQTQYESLIDQELLDNN